MDPVCRRLCSLLKRSLMSSKVEPPSLDRQIEALTVIRKTCCTQAGTQTRLAGSELTVSLRCCCCSSCQVITFVFNSLQQHSSFLACEVCIAHQESPSNSCSQGVLLSIHASIHPSKACGGMLSAVWLLLHWNELNTVQLPAWELVCAGVAR